LTSLQAVVEHVRPTGLLGLSTVGGSFTEEVLRTMGTFNDRPIVCPLSNPSDNSECTFEEAVKATDGRVLFASGSPFPPFTYRGKTLTPAQGAYALLATL
jgi:malate dehydrogenase (oxaloacetate-decarboxylating)(NADP+)